jgi:hypothetical protein
MGWSDAYDGIEDVRRLVPNGMAGEIVAIVAAAGINLSAEGREGRAIDCKRQRKPPVAGVNMVVK